MDSVLTRRGRFVDQAATRLQFVIDQLAQNAREPLAQPLDLFFERRLRWIEEIFERQMLVDRFDASHDPRHRLLDIADRDVTMAQQQALASRTHGVPPPPHGGPGIVRPGGKRSQGRLLDAGPERD